MYITYLSGIYNILIAHFRHGRPQGEARVGAPPPMEPFSTWGGGLLGIFFYMWAAFFLLIRGVYGFAPLTKISAGARDFRIKNHSTYQFILVVQMAMNRYDSSITLHHVKCPNSDNVIDITDSSYVNVQCVSSTN